MRSVTDERSGVKSANCCSICWTTEAVDIADSVCCTPTIKKTNSIHFTLIYKCVCNFTRLLLGLSMDPCFCPWFSPSVGPSGKMVLCTSNKDQDVPGRSLYPAATPCSRSRSKIKVKETKMPKSFFDGNSAALSDLL